MNPLNLKRLVLCLLPVLSLFGDQTPEPPAPGLHNDRSFNVNMFSEYLYWKYTSPALVFGRDGVGLTNSSPQTEVPVSGTGKSFSPHFKYQSGFRVGFGVAFGPEKAFDYVARYTWFYADPERTLVQNQFSASFLPLNWLTANALATSTYQSASLAVHLHIHYPEMQSGYTFKVNRYLALRPYLAIASILADGDLKAQYRFTTPTALTQIANTHGHCFSWSIGPRIGLDFIVRPVYQFALFCNVNFTQQCSQMSMRTRQIDVNSAMGEFTIQKGSLFQYRSIPLFGFEAGPVWDQWCCNDKYHFQVKLIWQISTIGGANLSFLNNNNVDVPVGAELRGLNVRGLFEF